MNELLIVVVIGAVIAFGALISIGNERQRRAIDALHQAYKQWAIQDLRLKRGTVSTQIQITDLTAWLTKVTSLALGYKTAVTEYHIYTDPVAALEFYDGTNIVVCTLEAPMSLIPMLHKKRSALPRDLRSNQLFRVDRKTPTVELSMLNAGAMFDIELPIAWAALTAQATKSDTLWAYILS